ncbi:MAG: cob(I)yrinic acid a,c-diamide adenosyltransferase [Marinomonas sp.]|jgi:cob(I)alamin adenosyltransferase|uniref:Corrinoid adenosyltransferase n=1 Tax=Marinomonas pontica TaxID=264739 RepID=A0ABN6WMV6_9GAMM|nr:cob(I)yrinic acid a,c-diamide adenosyltransferase [Marinomonas pontica]MCW8355081.1 cob(I)yrinic acid a,c-diamide adenosyltransferase [Marinomonas pontica]BDX02780.1 cob(I)yrinic acid a,c-diamide adenosyltransferase [Marinomonas pontica]
MAKAIHDAEKHLQRMRNIKKHVDQRIAKAQEDKGTFVLLTGNGKGKSSSALGMVARALGHGMKVGVVQFLKGEWNTGEIDFFKLQDNVQWEIMPSGFTWETQNREADIASSEEAWAKAQTMLADATFDLVVLDELTYLLHYEYLDEDSVVSALMNRPDSQHLVVTGRGATEALIELADTVSEIKEVKHAFKRGIKAQKGLEF